MGCLFLFTDTSLCVSCVFIASFSTAACFVERYNLTKIKSHLCVEFADLAFFSRWTFSEWLWLVRATKTEAKPLSRSQTSRLKHVLDFCFTVTEFMIWSCTLFPPGVLNGTFRQNGICLEASTYFATTSLLLVAIHTPEHSTSPPCPPYLGTVSLGEQIHPTWQRVDWGGMTTATRVSSSRPLVLNTTAFMNKGCDDKINTAGG